MLHYYPRHVSSINMPIFRRTNCIHTAPGIVSLELSELSYINKDGFRGLVVSMLASGTQVFGFKPGRSRWIFTSVKILSMPSSGGDVKESVPCPSFAACQRT